MNSLVNMQSKINKLISRSITAQTDKWFKVRSKNLSGTDMGVLIGANSYKTSNDLLEDKRNNFMLADNKYLQHGRKYEPVAVSQLEKKLNIQIQEIGYITNDKINYLGATPDGITIYKNEIVLCEIKCPVTRKLTGTISLPYYAQIQMQLFATGLETCLFYECVFKEMDKTTYNFYSGEKGFNKEVNEYWKMANENLMVIKKDPSFLNKYLPTMKVFYNKLTGKTTSRKRKFAEIDGISYNSYITKTYLKDFSNNNKFDAWLKMFGRKHYKNYLQKSDFSDELNNKIKEMDKKYINKVISICNENDLKYKVIPHSTFCHEYQELMTQECMKNKYDVIINPILTHENYVSNPSFLINEVAFETLFDRETTKGYHVFNKVSKNLKFKANNIDLSSDKNHTQYKFKNLFDSYVLFKNTKKNLESFIVGNKSYYTENTKKTYNDYDRYSGFTFDKKEYSDFIKTYTKWVNDVKSKKNDKYIYKTNPEYSPHLESNDTSEFADFKKQVLTQNNDPQMIYSIGSSKNQILVNKYNITSWKDPQLLKVLDDKDLKINSKNKDIIKKIINFNMKTKKILTDKSEIKNHGDWLKTNPLEMYVDFETMNDYLGPANMIYMIGSWIKMPNGKCEFVKYIADTLDHEGEKKIMDKWLLDIKKMEQKYATQSTIYCWSNAENNFINQYNKTHNENVSVKFIDILKIIKKECILVKGNLSGFSLKNYVKHMHQHGLITRNYKLDCNSGDKSIISAIKYYEDNDTKELEDLIKYNEVDCAVMHEIISAFRNKYT